MHMYTSTSQEELALGSLWSIKVIWYALEIEPNPHLWFKSASPQATDRPWLWFTWLPQHKRKILS